MKRRYLGWLIPLSGLLLTIAVLSGDTPVTRPLPSLEQTIFVWQYAWTPEVEQAVRLVAPEVGRFMVLAAEVRTKDNKFEARRTDAQWGVFAELKTNVTAVFRIESSFGKRYKEDPGAATDFLATLSRNTLDAAASSGLAVDEIQLDYDCPTAGLAGYAALLANIRSRLPGIALTITALPTWLGSEDCGKLLRATDRFTLQVHSVGKIGQSEDTLTLCDTEKIPGWTARAAKFGVDFDIALPTYGYRLQYDADGRIAAVIAESGANMGAGGAPIEVSANPIKMTETVARLSKARPKRLKGIAWFRLPVESDERNWTWPVLHGVMHGQAPEMKIEAELRTPQPFLYEVWIENAGEFRLPGKIEIPIRSSAKILASDILNGYTAKRDGAGAIVLKGTPPAPGVECMTAWFRVAEEIAGNHNPITIEMVRCVE